jgi:hypothetical protein
LSPNGRNRRVAEAGDGDRLVPVLPDTVEEVWFEVIAAARIGG